MCLQTVSSFAFQPCGPTKQAAVSIALAFAHYSAVVRLDRIVHGSGVLGYLIQLLSTTFTTLRQYRACALGQRALNRRS